MWTGKTQISLGKKEGCGSVTSERNGGVLCCYDGEANPRDNIVAEESDAPLAELGGGEAGDKPEADGGTAEDGGAEAENTKAAPEGAAPTKSADQADQ